MEDPHNNNNVNPFFISNLNNFGLVLVTHSLIGENYGSWCRAMVMALIGHNKLGFAYGSIVQPAEDDPQFLAWRCNNSIGASWILNFVSKEIQASTIYSNSASEIWANLHMRFHQNNGLHIFQLKKISFLALKFLHIHVRGQILLSDPFPHLNRVLAIVTQDDKQIQVRSSQPPSETAMACVVQTKNPKSKGKKYRPICTHCGLLGHTKYKCFKLHGFPTCYKSINQSKPSHSINQVVDSNFGSSEPPQLNSQQYQQLIY
ncbi:uncharacterized protein [Cicer arietinum]|uniref:uncharacterized protein n=1 Tax=Cicer arietinum TaxID=3827 RepID=UPI003CC67C7D